MVGFFKHTGGWDEPWRAAPGSLVSILLRSFKVLCGRWWGPTFAGMILSPIIIVHTWREQVGFLASLYRVLWRTSSQRVKVFMPRIKSRLILLQLILICNICACRSLFSPIRAYSLWFCLFSLFGLDIESGYISVFIYTYTWSHTPTL